MALSPDKRRTTLTLPAQLLAQAEELADKRNTTVSAIVAQAMEAGMESLLRKERALQTLEDFRAAYEGLSEEEMLMVAGVHLTPVDQLPPGER